MPNFRLLISKWCDQMVLSEGLVHSVTFYTKPRWYFYSDLISVSSIDTVPVQQFSISQ